MEGRGSVLVLDRQGAPDADEEGDDGDPVLGGCIVQRCLVGGSADICLGIVHEELGDAVHVAS